ncbi:MAG: monoheme cytochrome C [Bacteroidota bacterium]
MNQSEDQPTPPQNEWKESAFLNMLMLSLGITFMGVMAALMIIFIIQHPEALKASAEEELVEEGVQEIIDGKDVQSGFIAEGNYMLVKGNCTGCHSSKLVIQNRATRDGWKDIIVWMQETQKLWDLGQDENKILDYLAKFYGPEKKGRRSPLAVEEWYRIE